MKAEHVNMEWKKLRNGKGKQQEPKNLQPESNREEQTSLASWSQFIQEPINLEYACFILLQICKLCPVTPIPYRENTNTFWLTLNAFSVMTSTRRVPIYIFWKVINYEQIHMVPVSKSTTIGGLILVQFIRSVIRLYVLWYFLYGLQNGTTTLVYQTFWSSTLIDSHVQITIEKMYYSVIWCPRIIPESSLIKYSDWAL